MTRLCPDCHQQIINEGAHAESCPGPMVFTGKYQCENWSCVSRYSLQGGRCSCGSRRMPLYRVKREDETKAEA